MARQYPVGRGTQPQVAEANHLQQLSGAQPLDRSNYASSVDTNPTRKVFDGSRCSPVSLRVAIKNEPDTSLAQAEFGHASINESVESFKAPLGDSLRCGPSCRRLRVGDHDRPFLCVGRRMLFDNSSRSSHDSCIADSDADSFGSIAVNRWYFLSNIKSMSFISP
jgi:hypothetical protein